MKNLNLKPPEADMHLEMCILVCCVLSGKSFGLSPDIFRQSKHMSIMQAIHRLEKTESDISIASVFQEAKKIIPDLSPYKMARTVENSLPFVPGNVPLDIQIFYQREALKYHKQFLFFEAVAEAGRDSGDVDAAIMRIDKRLEELKQYGAGMGSGKPIKQLAKEFYKSLDDKNTMLKTGIASIDLATGGGLEPGIITILAARPSTGKTSMALNIILNQKNYKHVFFSLDTVDKSLIQRMVTIKTGIEYNSVKKSMSDDRVTRAMDNIYSREIVISDESRITLPEIEIIVEKEKPDIVWLDYLQFMRNAMPGVKFHSREDEIATYSGFFKGLAKKYNMAVVLLCQFNRMMGSDRPRMHHLRESGAIEQDADLIFIIHRKSETERELFCDKNKNGPTGQLEIVFVPQRMLFASKSNY